MPSKHRKLKRFRLYLPEEIMDFVHNQDEGASKFIERLVRTHAWNSIIGVSK